MPSLTALVATECEVLDEGETAQGPMDNTAMQSYYAQVGARGQQEHKFRKSPLPGLLG